MAGNDKVPATQYVLRPREGAGVTISSGNWS